MAGYRGHLALSAPLGVGLGVAGVLQFGVQPTVGVLGAILCTVSGMIPDLDSDSGKPVRETSSLLGAMVPTLMLRRITESSLTEDQLLLVMIGIYVTVRYGMKKLFKQFTVHRGMFHSIPAMLIAGGLAFLAYGSPHLGDRVFMSVAVMLGFFSHIALDEVYSVKVSFGGVAFNQFAGTAIKFYSSSWIANLTCYTLLAIVGTSVSLDMKQTTGHSLWEVATHPTLMRKNCNIKSHESMVPAILVPTNSLPKSSTPITPVSPQPSPVTDFVDRLTLPPSAVFQGPMQGTPTRNKKDGPIDEGERKSPFRLLPRNR